MVHSIQSRIHESMKPPASNVFTAIVTKVYPKLYKLDIKDVTSGRTFVKTPIASQYAGMNSSGTVYGLIMHPSEGDIVLATLINGSQYDPVVIGMLFTNMMTAPVDNQDDFVFQHKSGAKIKIAADGSINITPPAGKTVTIGAGTSVNSWFNSHTHMTSQGPSGVPMTPSPAAGAGVLIV